VQRTHSWSSPWHWEWGKPWHWERVLSVDARQTPPPWSQLTLLVLPVWQCTVHPFFFVFLFFGSGRFLCLTRPSTDGILKKLKEFNEALGTSEQVPKKKKKNCCLHHALLSCHGPSHLPFGNGRTLTGGLGTQRQ